VKDKGMNKKKKDCLEHFSGDVRMHVESAENYIQVNQLCLHLKTINNLRISSYNWSEKEGLVISLHLRDSVPLGDVLGQMPIVEHAYKKKKKDIIVELNNSFPGATAPVFTFFKEATPA
jgi:hypothetical protein